MAHHVRAPLFVLIALLGFGPLPISADPLGAFQLTTLVLIGDSEEAVQVALLVPDLGSTPGFLRRCDSVAGGVVLKESGASGKILGSAEFRLAPGDLFVVREKVHEDTLAPSAVLNSVVGTYVDVVVVLPERSQAACLEGVVDVIGDEGEVRHVGNKRKTLKAVDL
jgi:hypothetical protein